MFWVALHLPRLPLAALTAGNLPARPTVVTEGSPRAQVCAADDLAAAAGIRAGMTLASALALVPDVTLLPRDPACETQMQRWVALEACRYSPQVSLEFTHAVLLDVTASLKLFGGMRKLVRGLLRDVRGLGIPAQPAAAPTALGALLLARTGERFNLATAAALRDTLDRLDVAQLTQAAPHYTALQALGIRTLRQLRALPRAGATQRFGAALLEELDRAYGMAPCPLQLFAPPERFAETLPMPVPLVDVAMLQFGTARLVRALCRFLALRRWGITRLGLTLRHEHQPASRLSIGVSLTRSEPHLLRVIRERLERHPLSAPADAITLESEECAPLVPEQHDLFRQPVVRSDGNVLDRIRARLAESAVYHLALHADHRPEVAWRKVAEAPARHAPTETDRLAAPRPLWLLSAPRALEGTPQTRGIALLHGPERIESGWWDGQPVRRDYFVARRADGMTCWVFRTDTGEWFLHGLFA